MIPALIKKVQHLLKSNQNNVVQLRQLAEQLNRHDVTEPDVIQFIKNLDIFIETVENAEAEKKADESFDANVIKKNLGDLYKTIKNSEIYKDLYPDTEEQATYQLSDLRSQYFHVLEIIESLTIKIKLSIESQLATISKERESFKESNLKSYSQTSINNLSETIRRDQEVNSKKLSELTLKILPYLITTYSTNDLNTLKNKLNANLLACSEKFSLLPPLLEEDNLVLEFSTCQESLIHYKEREDTLLFKDKYPKYDLRRYTFRGIFHTVWGTYPIKESKYAQNIKYLLYWKQNELLKTQQEVLESFSEEQFLGLLAKCPEEQLQTLENSPTPSEPENSNMDSGLPLTLDTHPKPKSLEQDVPCPPVPPDIENTIIKIRHLLNFIHNGQLTLKKLNHLSQFNETVLKIHAPQQAASSSSLQLHDDSCEYNQDQYSEFEKHCKSFKKQYESLNQDIPRKKQAKKKKELKDMMRKIATIREELATFNSASTDSESTILNVGSTDIQHDLSYTDQSFQKELQALPEELQRWGNSVIDNINFINATVRTEKLRDDIKFALLFNDISTLKHYQELCPEPQAQLHILLSLKPSLRNSRPDRILNEELNSLFLQLSEKITEFENNGYSKEAALLQDAEQIYLETAHRGQDSVWGNNRNWSLLNDPRFDCLTVHHGCILALWQKIETAIRNFCRRMICLPPHKTPQCLFSTTAVKLMEAAEMNLKSTAEEEADFICDNLLN